MADEIMTEEKQASCRSGSAKIGIFFSILAIVLFFCAFGYGYFQLAKLNISLAKTLSSLQKQVTSDQTRLTNLQNSVEALQQSAQKSQDLVGQQEQLINEWRAVQKGDLEKWYAAEAQYLVKLANDHLQFTHNLSLAITLLKSADQVLQKIQSPNLIEIRKSLATDLAKLESVQQVDVTAIYLRLVALNNQVDQLPLPVNPLQENKASATIQTEPTELPWWKAGLQRTWQALRQIVIVRYNGSNTLPLVLPEEKAFLYQNLHAQLEEAMWGALHRNTNVYQASLARATSWAQQYFVQEAPVTKTLLQTLQTLHAMNLQPSTENLAATLTLFDTYFAQVEKAKTT